MLTRQWSDWGLGTENFGQFMIFEFSIYNILHVPNFKPVAHEGQLTPNGAILGFTGE